jgi:tape measure domain-containing protein
MAELGTAYVTVMPSTRGFGKALMGDVKDAGKGAGRELGGYVMDNLKGVAIGSALGGLVAKGLETAASAISSSIGSAVSRVDTLANYPKVMSAIGVSTEESTASISLMSDRLSALPTRLDAMAGATQQIYTAGKSMGMSLGDATKAGLGLNDMLLAGGKGSEVAESAMEQFTQALSKGKPDLEDWRALTMAAPAQMDQLAKSMLGPTANSNALYEALKSGKVTMADVMSAITRLDQEGGKGFASFASQAESATGGIQTSWSNAMNAVTKGVANVINHIGAGNITSAINGLKSQINGAFKFATDFIDEFKLMFDAKGFGEAFKEVGDAFNKGLDLKNGLQMGDRAARGINKLVPLVKRLAPVAELAGRALSRLSDGAAWAAENVDRLAIAFVALKAGKAALGVVLSLLGGLGGSGGGGGGSKGLGKMAVRLLAVGAACALAGAGLYAASVGVQNLVGAVTQLSSAGTGAQVWFGVMVGLLAAFVVVLVACGPALTANAVGMVALGGAVALVGLGVLMATAGIALLATQLPAIAAYGPTAAVGLLALGAAGVVLGAGAMVAGVGLLVLGAGALVAGAGVAALAVGALLLGAGLMLCSASVGLLALSLPLLAAYGAAGAGGLLACAGATVALGAAALVAGAGAMVAGVGLLVLGAGALVAGAGVAALAVGALLLGAGLMLCSASVLMVSAGLMLMGPAAMLAAAGSAMLAPALAALAIAAAAAAVPLAAAAPGVLAFGAAAATAGAGTRSMQSGARGLASSVSAAGNASNSAKAAVSALGSGASSATGGILSLALGLMAVPGPAAAAAAALRSVRSSANGMPRNVSINIRAYDHASAAIGRVAVALAQLNGRTSTVHINTVETTTKHAAGGIIRRHASGAVFTQPTYIGPNDVIGEAGAEYYDGQHIVPLQGRYGRGFAKEIADSMPAGGTTYVLNVDGATVNGDEHVRGLFLDLLTELKRRADM